MHQQTASQDRIVFFDGLCGLCNRAVDRLVRIDKKRTLRFAPLQGGTARALLPQGMADALESVVYLADGKVLGGADAAIRIMTDLGGWRKVYGGLWVVPRPLRDAVYRWIARNRYRWFGKRETCRLPTPDERERFLP
ncbi:MAG: DCC1-like thiol-disulfide oxidoreductase family protein [Flavobacteriales bacterium]